MALNSGNGQRKRVAALGLTLALAACGGGPSSGGPVPARSAVEGLTGRTCRYVNDFESTPPLRQLTRAGTEGNIGLWGRELGPADTVELSVRYAGDGRLEWVRAIRSTLSAERTASLEGMLLEAIQGTGTADWGVRVLVVGGEVLRTEPSVICRPERVSGGSIWSLTPSSPAAYEALTQYQGRRFPVRVALDEEGRVLDVELLRSTYSRWMDQYIIDNVRNSTFDPKLHDGIGIPSTLELRLRFPRR